ncbi:MAG: ribonuclease H-like domain-containing protein [Planctomycetes bacterium]|nr:ribonuclease H-like domain-containing protein [Planctomycetota bacterium]
MKLLSFDIEISDVFELREHEDMEKYAPFHISVAATAVHGGEERVWYSEDEARRPALNLTQHRAHELLEYLDEMQRKGFMVCAWNGLGFDLKWLGHQAEDMALAARIALKSYDPMYQFFSQAGFPVKLAKVAEAMGITQEKRMDGADAPKEWRAGQHQAVMDYVLGDCQMTNLIVLAIQKARQVRWVTGKGSVSSKPMPRLKPVKEVIQDPEPDQSWMESPLPRSKFHKWALEATRAITKMTL